MAKLNILAQLDLWRLAIHILIEVLQLHLVALLHTFLNSFDTDHLIVDRDFVITD